MAAAVPEVSGPEPVARYLETGLRLGRHLDGLVDAYYGPADLADRVASEPQRPLPALVADLRVLVADLDAGDGDLDIARRRWLRAQTIGLHTAARQLAGETVAFVDEVESCYGVRPEFVDHEVNGLVVEPDAVALGAALARLVASGEMRDILSSWGLWTPLVAGALA